MAVLRSILREPLVHFVLLALLVFAGYGLVSTETVKEPDRIIISAAKVEQLAAVFAKTWQRPPTSQELKNLIDDYVREEIYVREALVLHLDEDDAVIRRRLRQKMEFLNAAEAEAASPSDDELDAYLKENPRRFEIEPMLAFQQIFLSPERHGDKIEQDAGSILEVLRTNPDSDWAVLSDPTLLPAALPLTDKTSIGQIFGADFAEALDEAEPGTWSDPIASAFGLHLVRVTERTPGRMPALHEVRDAVLREWASDRRQQAEEKSFQELLSRYKVTIDMPAATGDNP
jgi:hypothetical protein